MPTTTSNYGRTAKLEQGALIQLTRDIIGIVPSIILFQYNPEEISRNFDIRLGASGDPKGDEAPNSQPYPPDETFGFTLHLDATDDLERGRPLTELFGIADRLAVLEKLIFPSQGLLGDLVSSVSTLFGGEPLAKRPTVPIVLLVLGRLRVLPVRVTSLSITEKFQNPAMMPTHAEVPLSFRVISPEEFRTADKLELDVELAKATYNLYRAQRDLLAVAHIATVVSDLSV